MKLNQNVDYVKERFEENVVLHSNLIAAKCNGDVEIKSSYNILKQKDTLNLDSISTTVRKI